MAQVPSATPARTRRSGSSDAASSSEFLLGSAKHPSPIARLMERTGYSIVQQIGQRRYGPPPDWEGEAPPRGCEVFVNKIPLDCFEDELVPVFDRIGKIYELRLIMDYMGLNKGYTFVVYGDVASAKESARQLNNYDIRKGRTLSVCMSVDNRRLFVGGIPNEVTKEDIKREVQKVTEGVVDVIVYHSATDKTKNKGFAFVEYDSHQAAVMARWNLRQGRLFLCGYRLTVDWAAPELEVDKEIMPQVKVLYIRNLMLSTTESTIEEVFLVHAPVKRVKKIIDHAFVHFHSKEDAHKAMNQLNGSILDGAEIQVMLAKPVNKDTYPRTPKFNRIATLPAVGFIPLDSYGTMLHAIYPASSYSIPHTPYSAAEYTLSQLGYCSEVPVTASSFLALPTQQLPLADTATGDAAPSVPAAYNPHPTPKPPSWVPTSDPTTAAAAAIYAPPPFPNPYQQMYGSPLTATTHQELYPQSLHPAPSHGF